MDSFGEIFLCGVFCADCAVVLSCAFAGRTLLRDFFSSGGAKYIARLCYYALYRFCRCEVVGLRWGGLSGHIGFLNKLGCAAIVRNSRFAQIVKCRQKLLKVAHWHCLFGSNLRGFLAFNARRVLRNC
ncbi:MAG: hypothetical protein DBX55_08375 [Verrucomicrobia bacterium]|nr:MAG: hypothetical protein DBX55_08375 [Verrucomicrobiota bacterium]